jgi:hypothetical protein
LICNFRARDSSHLSDDIAFAASDVDDYYTGMTIVLTKGAPSNLAAAELATIVEYRASGRVAYLAASSVTTLPQALDGYAITPTLKRALQDAPRGALMCLVALVSDPGSLSM